MANRVGGVVAVSQHIVERRIAPDALVLAKRGQQVGKRLARNVALADCLPERDENGMPGIRQISSAKIRLQCLCFFPNAFQRRLGQA